MYKVGEIIVYQKDVCKIKEIKENHIQGKSYYVLIPIDDDSLKIDVPTENNMIRNIISKEEAEALIQKIPDIDILNINEKNMENEYKKLLEGNCLEDLVTIIKTTYLRNQERLQNKKKISEKDESYFEKAERRLYNELSVSLGMSYHETKEYITNSVQKQMSR